MVRAHSDVTANETRPFTEIQERGGEPVRPTKVTVFIHCHFAATSHSPHFFVIVLPAEGRTHVAAAVPITFWTPKTEITPVLTAIIIVKRLLLHRYKSRSNITRSIQLPVKK